MRFLCSRVLYYVGDPLTSMLDALTNEFSVQQMGGVGGGMLRDLFAVSANLPVSIPSYKLMIYAFCLVYRLCICNFSSRVHIVM